MADEYEIANLVTRLTGDIGDHKKKMDEAAKVTEKDAEIIVASLKKVERAQTELRNNPALDEFMKMGASGSTSRFNFNAETMNREMLLITQSQKDNARENAEFTSAVNKKTHDKAVKDAKELGDFRQRIAKLTADADARLDQEKAVRDQAHKKAVIDDGKHEQMLRKQAKDLEDSYASAVQRHRQEELRVEKEIAAVTRQRMKQSIEDHKTGHLSQFGQTSTNIQFGGKGGGGGPPNPPGDGGISGALSGVSGVMGKVGQAGMALAAVYGVLRVAQTAVADSARDHAHQMEKSAELETRIASTASYKLSQRDKDLGTMNPKERQSALDEEIRKTGDLASKQSEAAEIARLAAEEYRTTLSKTGQAIPLFGDGSAMGREQAEALEKATKAKAEATKADLEALQKRKAEGSEGGPDARRALDAFKDQMEIRTNAVGKGHRAILLSRLAHDQHLSPEMLKKAESYIDVLHKTEEAHKAAEHATDAYFDAEEKGWAKVDDLVKQNQTPLEDYLETQKELNELKENSGLTDETYNRALDAAKKKFDGTTDSAKNLRNEIARGGGILAGSTEAYFKSEQQVKMLSSPSSTAVGPKGPRDDEIAAALKSIDAKTKKENDLKGVKVSPANISG